MSLIMCLGHKSYSGGNLTVAVSAATTGAGCATHRLHSERPAARDAFDGLPASTRSGSRLGRDLNHLEIGREALALGFGAEQHRDYDKN